MLRKSNWACKDKAAGLGVAFHNIGEVVSQHFTSKLVVVRDNKDLVLESQTPGAVKEAGGRKASDHDRVSNLGIAIKATIAAVILSEIAVASMPDPSLSVMYFAVMDIPMLAFLIAFFFGHRLTCGLWCPNLWVDRLCVHQTDPSHKSKGIQGLPTFVACSSQLLMLWDQTYFNRLWCMLELSIFVKCRGLKGLRFVPLWLPPWLLSQMLFAYIGARLLAIAVTCDPHSGINDTATYRAVHGDAFQWGLQRCLSYLQDCPDYLVFYVPSVIISVISFPRKIEGHKLMLENMRSFDIRDAKCALESDRSTIQMQVAELFDGLEEPTVSVALDTESTCESWDDEVALLHSNDPEPSLSLAFVLCPCCQQSQKGRPAHERQNPGPSP
eukprot:s5969_g4.t1